jgi:NADH:ubiquinone oxidoreductase subunit F (NADH-binding)
MSPALDALTLSPAERTRPPGLPAGAGLLLESVRVARAGAADRVDRRDGRATERWADHLQRWGARPRGELWLLDALEESGLTGYGGGHFPVARKWRGVLGTSSDITVVANGSESESLSGKDATLLRQRPHLVLDGLRCAMETVGAREGVVWLHESDRYTRRVVEDAIHERAREGRNEGEARDLGEMREMREVRVVAGPNTYLAGESSAIVRGLAGGPVLPTFRGDRGRRRRSDEPVTLVHNIETLARVALVARECAFSDGRNRLECFAPGPDTTLLTVLAADHRHVLEVPRRAALREAVARTAWADAAEPTYVLLAGFGGMWARWTDVRDVEVNEPQMRRQGRTLGAGIVAPLPGDACGVSETAAIVRYLAASSARQCGPCMFGLPALAHSLELLRTGSAGRGELRRIVDDLAAVAGRGACHHPDGATRLVASALETFDEDLARHAKGRPCDNAGHPLIPVPEVA